MPTTLTYPLNIHIHLNLSTQYPLNICIICVQWDGSLSVRDSLGGLVMQSAPLGGTGPYALVLNNDGGLEFFNGGSGGRFQESVIPLQVCIMNVHRF